MYVSYSGGEQLSRTVVRIQVGRGIAELHYIAARARANSDVPGLFGLLTARGATFDRRA
jgi:hypothetical protein